MSHVLCKAGKFPPAAFLSRSHLILLYSFCSTPDQLPHFWEGSLSCQAQGCSPSWPGDAAGELSPAACGVLLVPSRSLARPQSVTPSDHWLCAWMPVQRRGAPVNIILTSYELSVLAQIEVKTSWAATGFASPEWSTRQAGWVAKESWRLKLQLKVFREIHPAPGDSFEGNRVKDNCEIESWHFAFR